jgi:hypothetical protein
MIGGCRVHLAVCRQRGQVDPGPASFNNCEVSRKTVAGGMTAPTGGTKAFIDRA